MPSKKDQRVVCVGKALQEARDRSGFSQMQVAEMMGVPRANICNWEQGRALPSPLQVIDFLRACGQEAGDWCADIPERLARVEPVIRKSRIPLPRFSPERLRRLRRKQKLSQEEIGQLADVAPQHVSRIETGKQSPTMETAAKLAVALQCEIEDLQEVGAAKSARSARAGGT